MNKFAAKIDKMRIERGWSIYKLSQESGVLNQTIYKWFYRKAMITIPTLTQICDAFGVTLAEFFAESNLVEVNPNLQALYDMWRALTPDEKASVEAIVKNYANSKRA